MKEILFAMGYQLRAMSFKMLPALIDLKKALI
jgi:hypothetical protein